MTGSAPSGAMDVLLGVASRREDSKEGVWGRKGFGIGPGRGLSDLFLSLFFVFQGSRKELQKHTSKLDAKVTPGLPKWSQNVSQNH